MKSKKHYLVYWSYPDTTDVTHEADIYAHSKDEAAAEYARLFPKDVVHCVRESE